MIVKKDSDIIEQYTVDSSNFKGYAESVYIPDNSEEVIVLLKKCAANKTKVTFSGAGTGLTGGRVAAGGIILSDELFNKIVYIDEKDRIIRVQPAVTVGEIAEALDELGFMYPPNPTEKTASIGGNVSTNASGSRTLKYGATRSYVQRIKVILSDGERIILTRNETISDDNIFYIVSESGRRYLVPKPKYEIPNFKHAAGYFSRNDMDAIDLFIGSEGTLGFIEEIDLKFIEKPENVLGLIIYFNDYDKMFEFVSEMQERINTYKTNSYKDISKACPRLIEYFDDNSLNLLREKYSQISKNAVSAIWLEQEYSEQNQSEIIEDWMQIINKFTDLSDDTWTALDDKAHRDFAEFRHTLPEKVFEIITRNDQHKVGLDTAVPNHNLKNMYHKFLINTAKFNLDKVIYGHIGNNHLHANVFFRNESERINAELFYEECIKYVLSVGGTVSAEHGIGKLKVKYLEMMFGKNSIEQMKSIKKVLDEANILNIGNLF